MNEKQIHKFVNRYLEATSCSILEKSPAHIKVKLSPHADRELTNRPYYWSFVDRTGTEPETMTFLFVTDTEKFDKANTGEITGPREDLYFGSRRLDQLFHAAKANGGYVYLFEEPDKSSSGPFQSTPYTAWLGVNMLVEFASDRKREEIHSFGVSLATGCCVEQFHDKLLAAKLTPRLPANIHIARNGITFQKALSIIELTLERKLKAYDYSWAVEATARAKEEQERISSYYEPLLAQAAEEAKADIAEQYKQRQEEIKWQYEPRVTAAAINCGIFHLRGID